MGQKKINDFFDIERMTEETGAPLDKIEMALGFRTFPSFEGLCDIEKVIEIYDKEPKGTAKKMALYKRWRFLALQKVEAAANFEEAKKARNFCLDGSEEDKLALCKMIEFASSLEEAKEAYDFAMGETDEEILAIKKMAEFYKK